jgi:predicted acyl esterase
MDIFVSLRHLDAEGREITYEGANAKNYPISQGWLKASLRNIDADQSTPAKPIYTFDRVEKLIPGTPYALEIELWDSAAVICAGHSLVLEIGSQNQSGAGLQLQIADDREWDADVMLYTGGRFDSYLLLPVIPEYPSSERS